MLKRDHKEVDQLFKQFAKRKKNGEAEGIAECVEQVCAALKVHAEIEEEIFYPAVRDAIEEEDMMDEAEVEHEGVKRLVSELEGMSPDDDLYEAKVTVLAEYVRHHVKEEEGKMFPKVKRAKLDTEELGQQMKQRKQKLQGGNN